MKPAKNLSYLLFPLKAAQKAFTLAEIVKNPRKILFIQMLNIGAIQIGYKKSNVLK